MGLARMRATRAGALATPGAAGRPVLCVLPPSAADGVPVSPGQYSTSGLPVVAVGGVRTVPALAGLAAAGGVAGPGRITTIPGMGGAQTMASEPAEEFDPDAL